MGTPTGGVPFMLVGTWTAVGGFPTPLIGLLGGVLLRCGISTMKHSRNMDTPLGRAHWLVLGMLVVLCLFHSQGDIATFNIHMMRVVTNKNQARPELIQKS